MLCLCEKDHLGKKCNITNFCEINTCAFPRICIENLNGYSCDCPIGFYAFYCYKIIYCFHSPCGKHGKCSNTEKLVYEQL